MAFHPILNYYLPMQRFKILEKPILAVFALFVLTSSVIRPNNISEFRVGSSSDDVPKSMVDKKAIALYKERQQALKEALADY